MGRNIGTIPVSRLQPIIEKAISDREGGDTGNGMGGGVYNMCHEIATSTGKSLEAITRRIWSIRVGEDNYTPKKPRRPSDPASELAVRLLWENNLIWKTERVGKSWRSGNNWKWPTSQEAYDLLMAASIRRPVTHVTFETADTIITGLNLVHLWHTDLADLYFEGLAEVA